MTIHLAFLLQGQINLLGAFHLKYLTMLNRKQTHHNFKLPASFINLNKATVLGGTLMFEL